jgi:branched-chain amino acid transport system permease protein
LTTFLALTVVGITTGCIYALSASGLVVTYTTSGIFNFAHGATGMVIAFTYWELTVADGLPQWLGLLLSLGVVAPLLGAAIELVLMRRLRGASPGVTLVVSLGLLLTLMGAATLRWHPTVPRTLPQLFAGHTVKVLGVVITYHQLTMMAVTVLVAFGLRFLLYQTNTGIAMRAVVDDPDLASAMGSDPDKVAALSWALGAVLAGLAGILLAPLVTLDIVLLTLLVINGYAAAMVGRLRSLPLTFVGGIALGLAEAYVVGELPSDLVSRFKPALPTIFLYVVLLVLPQNRLRAGRAAQARRPPRVPTVARTGLGMAAFLAAAMVAAVVLSPADLTLAGQGVIYALIMLSLVLLVGYAGQVSLAQMTFVGLGAYATGSWFGGGSLLGVLAGAALAALVGAIVALPALRLRGLYLALSTLAFAQAATTVFFVRAFTRGGRLKVGRPDLLGLSLHGDRAFFLFICACFAAVALAVVWLRRGPFGRRLVALKDSPAACATLGINLTATKLAVFAISAGIAGLAGGLFGGLRTQVGSSDFEMFQSLAVLLLVYVAGITSIGGALAGGVTFGLFPRIQRLLPSIGNIGYLAPGLGALGVARNPYGWTNDVSEAVAKLRARRGRTVRAESARADADPDEAPGPLGSLLLGADAQG